MQLISIYVIGVLFGLGISVSGMSNPAKVLNFFDFAGVWDPSLALVLGGAVLVTSIGYRLAFRRKTPILAPSFTVPLNRQIDRRLLGGAALFGVGWGVTGFCPGGALPALGTGATDVLIFTAALLVGIRVALELQMAAQLHQQQRRA